MTNLPEDCPVKEILRQLGVHQELYKLILEHCDNCSKGKEAQNVSQT